MTRQNIVERKAAAVAERGRGEAENLALADRRAFLAARGQRAALLIRPEAAYATRAWVLRRFGRVPLLEQGLAWQTVPGAHGVAYEAVSFPDLVLTLDAGGQEAAQIGAVGRLQLQAIHHVAELDEYDARRLGFTGDVPGGIRSWFAAARGAGGVDAGWGQVESLQAHAWVRAGLDGPPLCVEDTLPIEIVYDHALFNIVCVRSLRNDEEHMRIAEGLRLREAATIVARAREEWLRQNVGRTALGDLLADAVERLTAEASDRAPARLPGETGGRAASPKPAPDQTTEAPTAEGSGAAPPSAPDQTEESGE